MTAPTPRFKVGERVTYGREGRTGTIVKLVSDARGEYHVRSDATGHVGLYWGRDLERVVRHGD